MKFFTKEKWLGLQDEKRTKFWEKRCIQDRKVYKLNLSKIKGKIGQRNYDFFLNEDLHGDHILNIIIQCSGLPLIPKESDICIIEDKSTSTRFLIEILCPAGRKFYLKYYDVQKIIIDYPSKKPLPFGGSKSLGTWGYHELTALRNGNFCHEILFDTGSTLLVEFKRFSYKKIKYKIMPGRKIPKQFKDL